MGRVTRWITPFAWLVLVAAVAGFALSVAGWRAKTRVNAMIADRSIGAAKPPPRDLRARYAAAWDLEREQHFDDAVRLYTDVQATEDPALAARAWFALGNAYFATAIKASRAAPEVGHSGERAEFGLARDAYRAALRIEPALHGARYNLELLERLVPARPGAGWRRNTDPITIVPNRRNGWTTIQESPKRGLP